MVSTRVSIPSLCASLVLCATASAQTARLDFQRVDGPMGKVHYDLATGRVTMVQRPGQPSGELAEAPRGGAQRTSVRSFNNTITTGYFTSGCFGCEFVDWATKSTGLTITTAVIFSYSTVMRDPSFGGPGASLDLALYSGTTGFCTLGTETDRFQFTGLPGITSTVPHSSRGYWIVTAFLGNQGISVPDGRIGWGYCFLDRYFPGSSIFSSATGPLLTDFGTNTGWNDAFDAWGSCPANTGTCAGVFNFGGCSTGMVPQPPAGTPCASFFLGLAEWVPAVAAACTARNAGTNPAVLVVTSPPRIGGTFSVGLPGTGAMAVTAGPIPSPGFLLTGQVFGRLLCDPPMLGPIQIVAGSLTLPIPKDVHLEGLTVCAQAALAVGGGQFSLTNALDCVFGG